MQSWQTWLVRLCGVPVLLVFFVSRLSSSSPLHFVRFRGLLIAVSVTDFSMAVLHRDFDSPEQLLLLLLAPPPIGNSTNIGSIIIWAIIKVKHKLSSNKKSIGGMLFTFMLFLIQPL